MESLEPSTAGVRILAPGPCDALEPGKEAVVANGDDVYDFVAEIRQSHKRESRKYTLKNERFLEIQVKCIQNCIKVSKPGPCKNGPR